MVARIKKKKDLRRSQAGTKSSDKREREKEREPGGLREGIESLETSYGFWVSSVIVRPSVSPESRCPFPRRCAIHPFTTIAQYRQQYTDRRIFFAVFYALLNGLYRYSEVKTRNAWPCSWDKELFKQVREEKVHRIPLRASERNGMGDDIAATACEQVTHPTVRHFVSGTEVLFCLLYTLPLTAARTNRTKTILRINSFIFIKLRQNKNHGFCFFTG